MVADIATRDEVLAQVGPDVDEQRQGQVGVEVALVHLVEHDGPDADQLRIVLDPPEQQAGRDDLDTRTSTAASVSADGVPDRLAHRFAEQVRQPTGSSAGCDATGLRDDDPSGDDLGDRGRDQGRLAGARRCLDHRDSAGAKRLGESGQARGDREVGRRGEQVAQRVGHSCSVPDAHRRARVRGTPPTGLRALSLRRRRAARRSISGRSCRCPRNTLSRRCGERPVPGAGRT